MFLILGWGYQPERVQAGIYLLYYTLLAFLPLLVAILFVYNSLRPLCLFLLCGDSSLVGGLFYVFRFQFTATIDTAPQIAVNKNWHYIAI